MSLIATTLSVDSAVQPDKTVKLTGAQIAQIRNLLITFEDSNYVEYGTEEMEA